MVIKLQENGLVHLGIELNLNIVQIFVDKSVWTNIESVLVNLYWGDIFREFINDISGSKIRICIRSKSH